MKLLGLTGGVGMGKSTASQILVQRGVLVVDTDILARQVVEPGQPALRKIQSAFGNEVIASDGQLRRDVLARIVFPNPAARQKLESITHPLIRELWEKQVAQWRAEEAPVACVVIPLLFETGAERAFDATVCVACSPATQRKRLQQRKWSPDQISQRIAAQFPAEKKIAASRFVVWSEGSLDILAAQLDRVLAKA